MDAVSIKSIGCKHRSYTVTFSLLVMDGCCQTQWNSLESSPVDVMRGVTESVSPVRVTLQLSLMSELQGTDIVTRPR